MPRVYAIETERLLLRQLNAEDVLAYHALETDPALYETAEGIA